MTDDLTQQLAGIQRAMAAPLPTPAELAAWKAEDRAMAERIHQGRPGAPLHLVYAVLETLRAVRQVDAAEAESAPEFPLPIRPDGSHHYVSTYCAHGDHEACRLRCKTCNAGCRCDCGHPDAGDGTELTRGELQDLVDSMGIDLYQASDKLDFVREMCAHHDAAGTPITTGDVRGWLAYTGCGGVLRLPDWAVAILATMSADNADEAAASGDAPDIAGERP